jgi:hypothetical protein
MFSVFDFLSRLRAGRYVSAGPAAFGSVRDGFPDFDLFSQIAYFLKEKGVVPVYGTQPCEFFCLDDAYSQHDLLFLKSYFSVISNFPVFTG